MTKEERGQLSVESDNIFPIIRQWLYSEQEIFLRELVSNAVDASSKRQQLATLGEVPAAENELRILIHLDTAAGTLSIEDSGIGMSDEEVRRYINQIAYSGLRDFVEKYENKGDNEAVIGHFGLGFYSAFMVSDKVEIETLSSRPKTRAVHWSSEDGLAYAMEEGSRQEIGTQILLHFSEEAKKTYDAAKLKEILEKYCAFMPYPIDFSVDEEAASQVNDPSPLWLRPAREITDAEYQAFYKKTFHSLEDPLFWIHLNLDYPFRLQGILYFPRRVNPYLDPSGRILVYSRQVFVSDQLREMIPEYLFLLQGCLDCPDLPLNVSRSYLQNDRTVRSLSRHIVSKVAERLARMFREERERYAQIWPSIERFVKVGMLQDERFSEKLGDAVLLRREDGSLQALSEIPEGVVCYRGLDDTLDVYAEALRQDGHEVYRMDESLDLQWMSHLEMQSAGKRQFRRVDAELGGEKEDKVKADDLEALYRKLLDRPNLKLEVKRLGTEQLPLLLTAEEGQRRLEDLQRYYRNFASAEELASFAEMEKAFREGEKLTLNSSHPLTAQILSASGQEQEELARYLYQLALLAANRLNGDELKAFLKTAAGYAEKEGSKA